MCALQSLCTGTTCIQCIVKVDIEIRCYSILKMNAVCVDFFFFQIGKCPCQNRGQAVLSFSTSISSKPRTCNCGYHGEHTRTTSTAPTPSRSTIPPSTCTSITLPPAFTATPASNSDTPLPPTLPTSTTPVRPILYLYCIHGTLFYSFILLCCLPMLNYNMYNVKMRLLLQRPSHKAAFTLGTVPVSDSETLETPAPVQSEQPSVVQKSPSWKLVSFFNSLNNTLYTKY